MSELFDKEVNAQKESLKKYFRGSRKLPQAHEKMCDENERNKKRKNHRRQKYFCGQKGVYKTRAERSCNGYQTTSALNKNTCLGHLPEKHNHAH